jgi:hypothetical protein
MAATMTSTMASDLADIDATIKHWRNRGVLYAWVARDLRDDGLKVLPDNWRGVRAAMITRQRLRSMPEREAA